ncbi:MAG: hypothetical protein L0177_18600, partial [Chloroflexi bacterium]|nr:hypothetical protein [Chloroflexota bacterium]
DYDPSQRFTRAKTGRDYWPAAHVNTTSPNGWLMGVQPFLPQVPYAAFARQYLKGQITPGPWTTGGVSVRRAGGIPWETSQNPIASLGRKSG